MNQQVSFSAFISIQVLILCAAIAFGRWKGDSQAGFFIFFAGTAWLLVNVKPEP